MEDRILAHAEPEASALLTRCFDDEGIQVVTGEKIAQVEHLDGRFTVRLETTTVEAERLLVTTGRTTNLGDIGLETVGLDPALESARPR